jgi:hypothetical protein
MIFYLNKGLILEQEIVLALHHYFNALDLPSLYRNQTITISNAHPFATLFHTIAQNESPRLSLFPAIVVTTTADTKPSQLTHLNEVSTLSLTIDDIDTLSKQGYMVTETVLKKLKEVLQNRSNLYGISQISRRQDTISVEIWSENIQLKNELYEAVRLFVCGFLREYLSEHLKGHDTVIFDNSIQGERSNNFNEDFGILLSGGYISFEVDYCIEQIVIDSEVKDITNIVYEIVNHVKTDGGIEK